MKIKIPTGEFKEDVKIHGTDNAVHMTIRAQMAAMICAGLAANPSRGGLPQVFAQDAARLADALIEELNKETNK